MIDLKAMARVLCSALIEGGAVLAVEFVWFHAYLLPLYITVGGAFYLLTLRFIKVLRKDDIALLHKLFPVRLRFLVSALSRIAGPPDHDERPRNR